jgi:hypothetical protein
VRQHSRAQESAPSISLHDLEQAIRAVTPLAVLAPPRILRRVVKQHSQTLGFGLRAPDRKTYVIQRAELLSIVDADELDLPEGIEAADTIILLSRPSTEELAERSAVDSLTEFWGRLFHAYVHLAFERQIAEGRLDSSAVQERVNRLGTSEFSEIRSVLRQDEYLRQPTSDLSIYIEFAALFLELRYFAPDSLSSYFPALEDLARVESVLQVDCDAASLFRATRLPGAPETPPRLHPSSAEDDNAALEQSIAPRSLPSERAARRQLDKANRIAARGNLVRAASLRVAAARRGTSDQATRGLTRAQLDMERTVDRLQPALGFDDGERVTWVRLLMVLAINSGRAIWSNEMRLLYDLQRVCLDHERGVYKLGIYRWVASGFREPLKRPLPARRDVLIARHLRRATRRLPSIRVSPWARARLRRLLQSALHRTEQKVRTRFRPAIETALNRAQLYAQNLPEGVARLKLVDELLDRIVERGFLLMGDLRDAVSRNNLKMADLASVRQLFLGDQLLQANRRLSDKLDGVYRRGEVYLTFPQRLSSLAFGTPLGRFLTGYVVLPFGGAFLIQVFVQHLLAPSAKHKRYDAVSLTSLLYIGLFLLALLHVRGFRAVCLSVLRSAGRAIRTALVDWPTRLLQLPWMQGIVHSPYFRVFERFLFRPLVVTAFCLSLFALTFGRDAVHIGPSAMAFLVAVLLLNSRVGRNVDEVITDWVVQAWRRFRIRVLATLARFVMDVFDQMLETIDRMLYAVDEWLQFRTGEGKTATAVKATLGLPWYFVNYVIRFGVNLLIEPQINPIKHFPVVTVSHKILLPLSVPFIHLLQAPLGTVWANTVGPTIILLAPGMFGFLVWELKENWRLYAANRPPNLGATGVGHHGETILQLLKPGFRSGTLPKLFARLRRADRKARETGSVKGVAKHLQGVRRVEEYVRRFVDRELLALLESSTGWGGRRLIAGEIRLATNRILAELQCPDMGEEGLWLSLEEQAGWLVAVVHRPGWLEALEEPPRTALANAMAGFYAMAGVNLVREQLAAVADPLNARCEIHEDALNLIPRQAPRDAVRCELTEWPTALVQPALDWTGSPMTAIDPRQLVFSYTAISWREWVEIWDLDRLQGGTRQRILEDGSLLPGPTGPVGQARRA